MNIRPETPADFPALYDFIREAFKTAPVSDGTEQDFVNKLRVGGNYVAELALVAEENGKIIGHIMLTETRIAAADGTERTALILAPLCVAQGERGKGYGAKLVEEAFLRARKLGYDSCLLVGDSGYYGRFGFAPMSRFGLTSKQDIAPQYTLACELTPGALFNAGGAVDFLG